MLLYKCMKVQLLVNDIKKDITSSGKRVKHASNEGFSIANRTAKIYKQNNLRRYYNITKSITGKIIKGTTVKEFPYLGGAIGMFIPIPLASPILMGLGFIAKYCSNAKNTLKLKY